MAIDFLPQVIAHRCGAAHAPENTLMALHKSIALGASMVEFDVCLSADGQAMVFHDAELARTTNGTGKIVETDAAKLQQLDAGSWFAEECQGQVIPTLEQMLQQLVEQQIAVNIELKVHDNRAAQLVNNVLDLLTQYWPNEIAQPLLSSFSAEAMSFLAEQQRFELGLLLKSWPDDWQAQAKQYHCVTVHLVDRIATKERIEEITTTGRQVLVYTVNELQRAKELFAQGVSAVFSDHADLLES